MGGNAEAEPFVPCASGARSEMAGTFDTGAKGFFVPVRIEQKNLGGNDMIDTRHYTLIEAKGYESKTEAYEHIRLWYSGWNGVTTYYDYGLWYIVQINALK